MLNQSGERTMLPSLAAPQTGHINLVYEFASERTVDVIAASTLASIPFDFYVKTTGHANARFNTIQGLPYLDDTDMTTQIILRGLLLNGKCNSSIH